MIKKIHSILENGKVNFTDSKGLATDGTKNDCLNYGFKYRGNKCYCFETRTQPKNDKNFNKGNLIRGASGFAVGVGNTISSGFNNIAIGFKNLIQKNANYSIALGKNSYVEQYGEIAISSSITKNRGKFSILHFNGTTTDATPTELFLGGSQGQRFFINEAYESAFAIDYTVCALNASANLIWTNYGHATYKFANTTLTEVGHTKSTTIRDSHLNYDIEFAPISGTPDYIEIKVEGASGHTVYWALTLKVTEVRYA